MKIFGKKIFLRKETIDVIHESGCVSDAHDFTDKDGCHCNNFYAERKKLESDGYVKGDDKIVDGNHKEFYMEKEGKRVKFIHTFGR